MEFNITAELIAGIVGGLVSLLFNYFPWLNVKFAALSREVKSGIMLGIVALITAVIYIGGCQGWFAIDIACDRNGFIHIVSIFITTIVANQSVFMISPQTLPVREAKLP